MQTLAALAHIDYNIPGQIGYEDAANIALKITNNFADVEELYRRMVFNVLFVNQDDHVKNTAFLMEKNGIWNLSPAYDLTFAYNPSNTWLKAHQMLINGKSKDITNNDLIEAGIKMGLKNSKCSKIIGQVKRVKKDFSSYLEAAGVSQKTIKTLEAVMNKING